MEEQTNAVTLTEQATKEQVYAAKVLELIAKTAKDNGIEPRTYSGRNGQAFKVYSGNGKHFANLLKLSTRQSVGDEGISINKESVLGSQKFDYTDPDGYKFRFAAQRGNSIEVHMSKDAIDVSIDDLNDIDLDIDL